MSAGERSSMTEPLVSIVLPCYNAQEWLGEAIRSALDQSYRRKEVIVIDDGSTDASLEVIRSFGERIRWATQQNRGGCAARNRGMALAAGDYIQFLDADDVLSADKIEKQVRALLRLPPRSVAMCAWNHFTAADGHAPAARCSFWKDYERGVDLLVDMWLDGGFFVPHCWLVPRRLALEAGRWNESLVADQDGEFFGRVLVSAGAVAFVEGACAHYRTPGKCNVSASMSAGAVESRFCAWESVQHSLLSSRDDRTARRAVLRRLRAIIYSYARHNAALLRRAAEHEARLRVSDFDPRMPPVIRYAVGMLGIRRGLQLRRLIKL